MVLKEKITKLRIDIDTISQLVKKLKSFKVITYELKDKEINTCSNIEVVPTTFSIAQPNKFNHIIRTDRGDFRFSTPTNNIDIYNGNFLDLKSKEINKCYDSLIFAKAWLGKALGELGAENPYKSGYKTKEDIEPTADVCTILNMVDFDKLNHIEQIDWLRVEIEKLLVFKRLGRRFSFRQATKEIKEQVDEIDNLNYFVALNESYKYLCEARFWLGFELQRIKESNN